MRKWLLELVYALSLKRLVSISFRAALHFVRRDYCVKTEIDNLKMMIEDHLKKGVNCDTESN